MYTASPWPKSWSRAMPMFCLAGCQQTSTEATWVFSVIEPESILGIYPRSLLKNSWVRAVKPTPVGREGRHTNGFSDQSSFLKVLPFGPDKDQLELLRIKIKFYIYPSPMFVKRHSSQFILILDSWVGAENYWGKYDSHRMPESFSHCHLGISCG